jgi:PAS domain S-box-containing protein
MIDRTQVNLEEELRQSREDLDRAQAVGHLGSWRLDIRDNVLTWSDENYRIFGLPVGGPLTYETFLAVVHPDDRAFVDGQWRAGLRGQPYDIEHRLLVAGQVKWVREKAFLEHDESGQLLGGFGITQDVTDRRAAEEALRESEAERAKQLERTRLARDLHDSVSQAIFAASLKAEALNEAGKCADPEIAETASQVSCLCRGALAELRTMLLELRGERLEDMPMDTLLRRLIDATAGRTSAQVELTIEGTSAALPTAIHVAFYRVAQEALNNVARHARATRAWVEASFSGAEARIEVRDNGRGFEQRDFGPDHFGLRSMRERAAEIGADLTLVSARDEGTSVILLWRDDQRADRDRGSAGATHR